MANKSLQPIGTNQINPVPMMSPKATNPINAMGLSQGPGAGPSASGDVKDWTSSPGELETILDNLFKGSVFGGGGDLANTMHGLALGQLSPALAQLISAQTAEQMKGARFGSDLGRATATSLGQVGASQMHNAISQILGLGGTTAGMEFTRSESALDRLLQDIMNQRSTDPLGGILPLLLQSLPTGGSGG